MFSLAEVEKRILAELEEAGEEHVSSLLNAISSREGERVEIATYQSAMKELVSQGMVNIELFSLPSGVKHLSTADALLAIDEIGESYKFSDVSRVWTDVREKGPPYFHAPLPRAVITDVGYTKASELLETQGSKWWRR